MFQGRSFFAKHGLNNLLENHDICVYSLPTRENDTPSWLIVLIMKVECMTFDLDTQIQNSENRYTMLQKMDYNALTYLLNCRHVKETGILCFEK